MIQEDKEHYFTANFGMDNNNHTWHMKLSKQ